MLGAEGGVRGVAVLWELYDAPGKGASGIGEQMLHALILQCEVVRAIAQGLGIHRAQGNHAGLFAGFSDLECLMKGVTNPDEQREALRDSVDIADLHYLVG
ncbi:MAG: hypothetical protein JWM95_702 [Gemmatimonadetes bacterium]|nr:hypothetical protein [Gemmatimonadota bacterium]